MTFNKKEHNKKYKKSVNGKLADKKYRQSKKGKKAHRKANNKYDKSKKGKQLYSKYRKSDKGKIVQSRMKAKRRLLGYNPVNEYFDGCNTHHFNKNDIIYVPKKLHQSIYHNVFTGKNMIEINSLAFTWLNYIENKKV